VAEIYTWEISLEVYCPFGIEPLVFRKRIQRKYTPLSLSEFRLKLKGMPEAIPVGSVIEDEDFPGTFQVILEDHEAATPIALSPEEIVELKANGFIQDMVKVERNGHTTSRRKSQRKEFEIGVSTLPESPRAPSVLSPNA
jgi:hypothetical protein